MSELITVSREELTALIKKATEEAVSDAIKQTFSEIGLFIDDPDERRHLRMDFSHARRFRLAYDTAKDKIGSTVITIILGAFFSILWVGFSSKLKQP